MKMSGLAARSTSLLLPLVAALIVIGCSAATAPTPAETPGTDPPNTDLPLSEPAAGIEQTDPGSPDEPPSDDCDPEQEECEDEPTGPSSLLPADPLNTTGTAPPEGGTLVYLSRDSVHVSSKLASVSYSGPGQRSNIIHAHHTVQEGLQFRVRVSFDGVRPTEGSCDLLASDSQTNQAEVAVAWANGEDVSVLFQSDHTNEEDDGRYVRVSIIDCSFPDLDRQNTPYRIGANKVDVTVTTAGPLATTDNTTYAVVISNLRWEDELDWHGNSSYFKYSLDWRIAPASPIEVNARIEHDDGADLDTVNFLDIPVGQTSGTATYITSKTAPGTQRTVTVRATDVKPTTILGHPAPAGAGTYTVNTDSLTATMTVFDWSLPDTSVEFESLTGPATDGGSVVARFAVTDRPTEAPYFQIYLRAWDNWLDPKARGLDQYLGNYYKWYPSEPATKAISISVPRCCDPFYVHLSRRTFLPEAQRPNPRIITVSAAYQGDWQTKTIEVAR